MLTDASETEAETIYDDSAMTEGFTKSPFDPGAKDPGNFAFSVPKGGFAKFTLNIDVNSLVGATDFTGSIS